MNPFVQAMRRLVRQRGRTLLALAGVAVSSAMLLDMVLLSGGIETSFAKLLSSRGWQVRVSPAGTLPFDTEATMPGATQLLAGLRADPAVERAGPVLGTALYGHRPLGAADSLVTLFGYGIDPAAQALYEVEQGADLAPGDTLGVLLSEPARALLAARVGDTVRLDGGLDPQMASAAVERRLVVRGLVRWLYDYRGQASIGTVLPTMQRLARQHGEDRISVAMIKLHDGVDGDAALGRLRRVAPGIDVRSVAELVGTFRQRLVYFKQLALILGTVSLVVTVLLIGTLLTIAVNERLAEIATLRAIGVQRRTVLASVLADGLVLTIVGGSVGLVLGLAAARYLDSILTGFPGLPAAFSFFVARPADLLKAGVVLLATGMLAGLYPAWLAASTPIAATLRAEAT